MVIPMERGAVSNGRLVAVGIVLFAFSACGSEEAPPPAAFDAGPACTPSVLCYAGCPDEDPTCLSGVLDLAACGCRNAAGEVVPLPTGGASEVSITGLTFRSTPPSTIATGETLEFALDATYSNGLTKPATATAVVTFSPSDVAQSLGTGRYRITSAGAITLTATVTYGGKEVAVSHSFTAFMAEARALWVTRFEYSTPDDVRAVVNAAADARFNVVLFQIRGAGDAYYRSTLEPWAARLSGTLGQDPGWDPLQVAIETAHARGIELHAYFNVFSAWSATGAPGASPAGQPTHALTLHPEWVEQDAQGETNLGEYQWFAPGIEAVRTHTVAVARELLNTYDVDGLHLDRIRYAGKSAGYNALEREAFAASGATDFDAWRTEQVNAMVRSLHQLVREVKPRARLSASVWGIHTPLPGCSTSAGLRDYFQDSWAWTEGDYIDALMPMIYWADGTGCTDFGDLLADFMAHRGGREIWAGLHALDKDDSCSGNCAAHWTQLETRINVARRQQTTGVTIFASGYLDKKDADLDKSLWQLLGEGPFHAEALVPELAPLP
jgi:uncharacterized lipoprotein YddW (UPF0748 family)